MRKYVSKNVLAFRIKNQIAFPPGFWCVCARGKKKTAGDAFEIEKGNGDVRDYNIRTAAAAAVLYDTSTRCTYSSLEPLVPGAAYLVISGRVDMLTNPVPAARAAVATGAWVESKHECI